MASLLSVDAILWVCILFGRETMRPVSDAGRSELHNPEEQGVAMYIVTGGAGFIGSAMIWRLNEAGIDDILVVDNLACTDKWRNLVDRRYQDYVHRDEFRRMVQEGRAPEKVEAVFHMGACSSTTERDADFLMSNNLHYTQMMCRYALERGARFITASSAATYGDGSKGFSDSLLTTLSLRPLNMYGYSKQLFDLWAYRKNLLKSICCVKFFNVYGPNEYHKGNMMSVACKSFHELQAGGALRLFKSDLPQYPDGGQMRDFVYVKDCVNVMFWLLEHPEVNGIMNIGSGKARTWNDLANAVYAAMEKTPDINYIDMPAELKGRYQYYTQADMGWLERVGCDVAFHSLEDGVRDYIRNYLMQPNPYL